MPYLEKHQIELSREKLSSNLQTLGRQYKARKSELDTVSIKPSEFEDFKKLGYSISKKLKTKLTIEKEKSHGNFLEDKIWCLMYRMGFRILNLDETFRLKYGEGSGDFQQIDVVAINEEVAILIECKSSEKVKNVSYKEFLESASFKIDGFRKSIEDLVGKRKVKYVLATHNQKIGNQDKQRMIDNKIFHLDDNAYSYVENLIKSYKNASIYQFLGLLFKGEVISNDLIDVSALEGSMGGKKYYMFSIEPSHLLKTGFILHRTRVNETENPTYQRLLVPSRLNGITRFINEGGFFPNSIIVNFKTSSKIKLTFDRSSSKGLDSKSRHGVLRIPNIYSIAYIIDGQHRLYGFANSEFTSSSTIPVVAFENLESEEQLTMFLDINENQKKISPRLKLTLQEDISWSSNNLQSRMKALRSGIINKLADDIGPLSQILSIGEDNKELSPTYIDNALKKAPGMLPKIQKKTELVNDEGLIYNVSNQDFNNEMYRVKDHVSDLISLLYIDIEKNYTRLFEAKKSFIRSNRGLYAIIYIIGSLNNFLTKKKKINISSSVNQRLDEMQPYMDYLLSSLSLLEKNDEDPDDLLKVQGHQAQRSWSMSYEKIINSKFDQFLTDELIEYQETQDKKLQSKAKELLDSLEKMIKIITLNQMYDIFGSGWELEITQIKKACSNRADDEKGRIWKVEGVKKNIKWTDMFDVLDYFTMVSSNWTKSGQEKEIKFQNLFSLKTDDYKSIKGKEVFELGVNSDKKSIDWFKKINNYRSSVAHAGSKSYGLVRKEVTFVEDILISLKSQIEPIFYDGFVNGVFDE